jgi:hypothetical protein
MSDNQPLLGTFHDAITGETITRELTPDEIAALPKPSELILGEQLPVDVVVEPVVEELEPVDEE